VIIDALSVLSTNQLVTTTAVSQSVYDVAGVGVGQPVTNIFGLATQGSNPSFGEDLGGGGPHATAPQLAVLVGTAFTAGGAATLRVQLQAAVDTNNTGTPGTWDTIDQTDDIPVAVLTAGAWLARFTVPTRYPGQGFPRFYRVNYLVTTGPFTAGSIGFAGLLTGIDDIELYPANY
jgi:hypothetical protein